MNLSKNQLIIVGIAGAGFVFLALVFAGIIPVLKTNQGAQAQRITLSVLGTDNEADFAQIAALYGQIRPNVTIDYARTDEKNYDRELLSALASGSPPDIFFIRNSQTLQYATVIAPIPFVVFSESQIDRLFPSVVKNDFLRADGVYALPLYIDTLALFYNRDILDAKGTAPPKDWEGFQEIVSEIREIDDGGRVLTAGASLGGSLNSVEHATDILSLIMLQLGVPLPSIGNAQRAIEFYLRFSDSARETYTWNDRLPNSLNMFADGRAGMMFGYAGDIARLKDRGPHLDYRIAPMMQFVGASPPINFASYSGMSVSRRSKNPEWAWDFVINAATNPQIAAAYSNITGKPPALRGLIDELGRDTILGMFARQALSARSVALKDYAAYQSALSDMIASVLLHGRNTLHTAIGRADAEISASQR